RSTPAMLASVASQARTSANSSSCSGWPPPRRAAASSPTSSMNHMNVPSTPRRLSLTPYSSRISCCNCPSVTAITYLSRRLSANRRHQSPGLDRNPATDVGGSPKESASRLRYQSTSFPQQIPQPHQLVGLLLLLPRRKQHLFCLPVGHVDLQRLARPLLRVGLLVDRRRQPGQPFATLQVVAVAAHQLRQVLDLLLRVTEQAVYPNQVVQPRSLERL